uniref:Phosphotransferase n=1 Tax=Macrostomum lignano TaxID=282301 RepID=A0A1I8F2K7_9PLAT
MKIYLQKELQSSWHVSDSRKKIPALPEKARALIASLTLSESDYHAIELAAGGGLPSRPERYWPPQCVPMLCSHVTAAARQGRAQRGWRRRRRRRRRRPRPATYLALDLGGTNYRVLLVRMRPPGQPPEIVENVYSVPGELMRAAASTCSTSWPPPLPTLWPSTGAAHLAENPAAPLRLGFTFSFPCEQRGLASARLLGWTKATRLRASLGNDARSGRPLRSPGQRHVGTLAACALEDPACMIGLIVGTGTNAAYVERVAAVDKYSTELPAGGESGCHQHGVGQLRADRCLERTFEKLCSGMYLGELVRLAIQQLVSDGVLFDGRMPEALRQPMSFHTKYLSERMIDKINELHPDAKFLLRLSEDGSGKGAAAIAAMA